MKPPTMFEQREIKHQYMHFQLVDCCFSACQKEFFFFADFLEVWHRGVCSFLKGGAARDVAAVSQPFLWSWQSISRKSGFQGEEEDSSRGQRSLGGQVQLRHPKGDSARLKISHWKKRSQADLLDHSRVYDYPYSHL